MGKFDARGTGDRCRVEQQRTQADVDVQGDLKELLQFAHDLRADCVRHEGSAPVATPYSTGLSDISATPSAKFRPAFFCAMLTDSSTISLLRPPNKPVPPADAPTAIDPWLPANWPSSAPAALSVPSER